MTESKRTGRNCWKAFEREAARFFGTERFIPQTTNDNKASCDFATETIVGECKYRATMPTPEQIKTWLQGVCERAKRDGKAGVLCVKVARKNGFWIVEMAVEQIIMWHSTWRTK
jgi:hypothetical protein